MSIIDEIDSRIAEIKAMNRELEEMSEAWAGNDPCEAAASDPGLQYELGQQIDQKLIDLRKYLVENVKD